MQLGDTITILSPREEFTGKVDSMVSINQNHILIVIQGEAGKRDVVLNQNHVCTFSNGTTISLDQADQVIGFMNDLNLSR